jgi:hypothetical protein
VDNFHFTVVVPDAPDSGELFAALSEHMARYIGLSAEEAHQASGVLNRLVAQRLARSHRSLAITFVRPHETAPVRVEIAGPALPDDHAGVSDGGGIRLETDGRESRLTLSWTPRVDG